MFKGFFKKKHDVKSNSDLEIEVSSSDENCLDLYDYDDDIEDKPEKNIQIIEYLNSLKEQHKVLNVLMAMKSSRDVNIVLVVKEENLQMFKIQLESDFYLKRDLNIVNVNRVNNKLMALTKDECTFKITIISKQEFEEHYSKK